MQKFCFTSKRFSKLRIGLCMFCELLRRQSGLLECVVLFFGHSVVSSSLWPQGLLYTRLPCPPLSPGVCSNSRPLSWLCHPTISPCVIPISPCPQSFPASGSFQMSQLFTSGGQRIGASASASVVLPMNIQDWFPLGLTGLISLQSKGLSRIFSSTTVRRHQLFGAHPFFIVQLSHPYITTGKATALTIWIFEGKVISMLFNMLSLSLLFFQGATVFQFHGCNHCPGWFWSPRK